MTAESLTNGCRDLGRDGYDAPAYCFIEEVEETIVKRKPTGERD
jgi:hypothetical protein